MGHHTRSLSGFWFRIHSEWTSNTIWVRREPRIEIRGDPQEALDTQNHGPEQGTETSWIRTSDLRLRRPLLYPTEL